MKEKKASCEKQVGSGVGFDRIRRITGYLVGTTDRWNNAKRAEESDRVKHTLNRLGEDSGREIRGVYAFGGKEK